ncbi:MAG: hypothetical protein AAB817_02325 [Patescibacteria group bacterium]
MAKSIKTKLNQAADKLPPKFQPDAVGAVVSSSNFLAALSYVWILFLIPLLGKRQDPACQWHGKQGLVLFLVEVVGTLVFWIPVIGWALWLVVLLAAIWGFLQALQGNYWAMPVLGKYAKKIQL